MKLLRLSWIERFQLAFWATAGLGTATLGWIVDLVGAWGVGNGLGIVWYAALCLWAPFFIVNFWYRLFWEAQK